MATNLNVTKMKNKIEVRIINMFYDENAKKTFIARMQSEEENQVNLKIKIATFVVYELSKLTNSWFKDNFLSDISEKANENKEILKAKRAFANIVAGYLITIESEIDSVKKILAPFTEKQKRDYWKPIVSDAFILAGIYLYSSVVFSKERQKMH